MTDISIALKDTSQKIVINIQGNIIDYEETSLIKDLETILDKTRKNIYIIDDGIVSWDSSFLSMIFMIMKIARKHDVLCNIDTLSQNIKDLIQLAFSVDRKPELAQNKTDDFFEKLGKETINITDKTKKVLNFCHEICLAFIRLCKLKSIMRFSDFAYSLDDCGPKAVGIVTLISFLVGLILAFVGAIQLQQFGAQIFVASLVCIGMCRIMGAIMVGIIMAGRTGSSYAATIGTMQVNEELDALQTMGLSKIDFLVMPRILALLISLPILTMLADFLGIIGGAFVGIFLLDLPYQEYYKYTIEAFQLNNFLIGIFHSFCFGIIIALCGCYQGLTCGKNSDSVGIATTKSVVTAIVWMIVATGIITLICMEFGI